MKTVFWDIMQHCENLRTMHNNIDFLIAVKWATLSKACKYGHGINNGYSSVYNFTLSSVLKWYWMKRADPTSSPH